MSNNNNDLPKFEFNIFIQKYMRKYKKVNPELKNLYLMSKAVETWNVLKTIENDNNSSNTSTESTMKLDKRKKLDFEIYIKTNMIIEKKNNPTLSNIELLSKAINSWNNLIRTKEKK